MWRAVARRTDSGKLISRKIFKSRYLTNSLFEQEDALDYDDRIATYHIVTAQGIPVGIQVQHIQFDVQFLPLDYRIEQISDEPIEVEAVVKVVLVTAVSVVAHFLRVVEIINMNELNTIPATQ